MKTTVRTVFAAIAVAGLLAADWPQWRGLKRDGALEGVRLPAELPQKLNRQWSVRVGEGHSSPVLSGGKLFIFAREGNQETVYALEPASGKTIWKQSYPAPYKVNFAAASHGAGPKSTPVVADGKVVTLGISGVLSCWDVKDGRLIWRKEFSKEYNATSPTFGTAMSPMIDRGMVIANVGGEDSGAIAAFDLNDGAMKWRCTGDGPGYASPIAVELAGVRQFVTQTQKNIAGVRADNGQLLWRISYTTDYSQNIVTPILFKDSLILAGLNNPTTAVHVLKDGEKYTIQKIWDNPQASMYMSSPVLIGDLLFGFTHKNKGQFFAQDPNTGKVLWTSPARQGDNAALEATPTYVFALKDDANLIVIRAIATGYEQVRQYKVADSATYAHPVITDNGVFVKDVGTAAFWSWK